MRRKNGRWVSPQSEMEERQERRACDLQIEAWKLLGLLASEFASDPMSVQCFDLRVVARVLAAVEDRKQLERAGVRPAVLTEGSTDGSL